MLRPMIERTSPGTVRRAYRTRQHFVRRECFSALAIDAIPRVRRQSGPGQIPYHMGRRATPAWLELLIFSRGIVGGVPYGIRTRVTNVKGWCPRPLDEGDGGAVG